MEETSTQFYAPQQMSDLKDLKEVECSDDETGRDRTMEGKSHFVSSMKVMENSVGQKRNQFGNLLNMSPLSNEETIKVKAKGKQKRQSKIQNIENQNLTDFSGVPTIIKRPQSKKSKSSHKKLGTEQTIVNTEAVPICPNARKNILIPVPQNEVFKASLRRISSCWSNNMLIFSKGNNEPFLLSERISKVFGNKYEITLPEVNESSLEKDIDERVGVVEGNFSGSIFNVYERDKDELEIVATIYTESSAKKVGGVKEVTIYMRDRSMPTYLQPRLREMNLKQIYEENPSTTIVTLLKSMKPEYNGDHYCLPFKVSTKVESSTHNIIFVTPQNRQALKLFKTKDHRYHLYISNPVTPLVGYAYALSSFTFKLASQ